MKRHRVLLTFGVGALFLVALLLAYRLGKHSGGMPSTESAETRSSSHGKILFYRNPMNPQVTSPVPAKDEMGMDFVPVYAEGTGAREESNVTHRAPFHLSNERQQLIGLTTAKVSLRELGREVRASGQVAFDPDLFTAIEEYRQELLTRSQMGADPAGQIERQTRLLIESSKTKLRLMGLSEDQIRRLGDRKTDPMSLILPKGNVWIYAEVYEYEIEGLKPGQKVTVETPAAPGKRFQGKLVSISPVLDPQTRTVKVRALVPDPEGALRPDAYVNVVISQGSRTRLVVPSDSVLHSGDRNYVFVVRDGGWFVPRQVHFGISAGGFSEVISGLTEGETVATAANFLIDSESSLRAATESVPENPHSGGNQ